MKLFSSTTYQGTVYSCEVFSDAHKNSIKLKVCKFQVDPSGKRVNNMVMCEYSSNIAQNSIVPHVELVHIKRNMYIILYEINKQYSRVVNIHINKFDAIKCETENLIIPLDKIKLEFDSSNGTINGVVKLIDNNTVILTSENKLYLARKTGDSYAFIDKRKLICKVIHINVCPMTKIFVHGHKCQILFLVTNKGIVCFLIEQSLDNISLQQIDETSFVPSIYFPIIRQILILECSSESSPIKHKSKEDKVTSFDSVVFVSTSKSQILKIKNGKVESCIKIPFDNTVNMFMLDSSNSFQFLLVLSKSGKLCILDGNQVMKEIDGIVDCYVDDFVGCGSNQLLAFPQYVHQSENRFLLSDFSFYHIDQLSGIRVYDDDDKEDDKESLKLVVKALQSKLQAKMCELQRAEQVYRHKEDLIQKSVQAIENMATGRDIHNITTSTHLVPVLGDRSKKQTTFTSTSCVPSDPVITDAPWQRVVEQKWVVGITVSNKSDSSLENITLSMVPINMGGFHSDQDITSNSSAFLLYKTGGLVDDNTDDGQPQIKKLKLDIVVPEDNRKLQKIEEDSNINDLSPDTTVYLTVCTELPRFDTRRGKTYSLVLGWSDKVTTENSSRHRAKVVGSVSISPQDVLASRYDCQRHLQAENVTGIEKRRNLIALNLCQQLTRLQLRSKFSNCRCVADVLQRHLGSVYVAEYDQHVIGESRTLAGVRVKVVEQFINKCSIAVYTSDTDQLLLFIHSLYQHLPDDVIIQLSNQINQDKLVEEALSALQKEVSGISSTVKQVIKTTEEKSAAMKSGSYLSMDVLNDPDKSRMEFKAKQEEMRNKSPDFVDSDDMKKIMEVKKQLEMQTDLCVEKMGKFLKV